MFQWFRQRWQRSSYRRQLLFMACVLLIVSILGMYVGPALVPLALGASGCGILLMRAITTRSTLLALIGLSVMLPVAIGGFARVYTIWGMVTPDKSISYDELTAWYFSAVTWTTLGFGDFAPTAKSRPYAASEAIIGYVYMAVAVSFLLKTLTSPIGPQYRHALSAMIVFWSRQPGVAPLSGRRQCRLALHESLEKVVEAEALIRSARQFLDLDDVWRGANEYGPTLARIRKKLEAIQRELYTTTPTTTPGQSDSEIQLDRSRDP